LSKGRRVRYERTQNGYRPCTSAEGVGHTTTGEEHASEKHGKQKSLDVIAGHFIAVYATKMIKAPSIAVKSLPKGFGEVHVAKKAESRLRKIL